MRRLSCALRLTRKNAIAIVMMIVTVTNNRTAECIRAAASLTIPQSANFMNVTTLTMMIHPTTVRTMTDRNATAIDGKRRKHRRIGVNHHLNRAVVTTAANRIVANLAVLNHHLSAALDLAVPTNCVRMAMSGAISGKMAGRIAANPWKKTDQKIDIENPWTDETIDIAIAIVHRHRHRPNEPPPRIVVIGATANPTTGSTR